MRTLRLALLCTVLLIAAILPRHCLALDSDVTRQTLAGRLGMYVIVEELQPNLQKYAKRQDLSKEQIQKQVEALLRSANIRVLSGEAWLATPGKPVLYINVNTHELQKYEFAYNVSVQLRQVVVLEANPAIRTFAPTWSQQMTGVVNVGTTGNINEAIRVLMQSFIKAYRSVNPA